MRPDHYVLVFDEVHQETVDKYDAAGVAPESSQTESGTDLSVRGEGVVVRMTEHRDMTSCRSPRFAPP